MIQAAEEIGTSMSLGDTPLKLPALALILLTMDVS